MICRAEDEPGFDGNAARLRGRDGVVVVVSRLRLEACRKSAKDFQSSALQ